MEADYSKREIDEHFKDVIGKVDEANGKLDDLNRKVGIQNGRVAKLEGKWNGVVMAGIAAVFLFGIISSLIVYSFTLSEENLKSTILLELKK